MANKSEMLRAELKAAELEEKLVAAKKKKGDDPGPLKHELREARRAFREMREAVRADVDNG